MAHEDKDYTEGLGDGAYITMTLMLALGEEADNFSCALGSTIDKTQILGEWIAEVSEFWDVTFKQEDGPAVVDFDEYIEDLMDKVAADWRKDPTDIDLPGLPELQKYCTAKWSHRL